MNEAQRDEKIAKLADEIIELRSELTLQDLSDRRRHAVTRKIVLLEMRIGELESL